MKVSPLAVVACALSVLLAPSSWSVSANGSDWPMLGNGQEMQHHSDLTKINRQTIDQLGLAWAVEMPTSYGLVGNPLIQDGVIYQGGPGGRIFANDLASGELLWSFEASYPPESTQEQSLGGYWARQFNRGVALYKDKVIIATGDCRLVAVDRKSGTRRWEAQSCDSNFLYGITAAPRVGGGMVFTGNSNLEAGSQPGYVDAFDADTGEHRWRFYTVPGNPETESDPLYIEAAKTWGTDWYSMTRGPAAPWDAMVYDEELDQLVIGTGSVGPQIPTQRPSDAGDELFSNSVVALDAKTGKYRWHHKQMPHDGWNYESAVGLMVADLGTGDQSRRVVISVPKQGFAYIYDAASGEYLSATQYVETTWSKGLDENGRPVYNPDAMYWNRPDQETLVLPGGTGAHGWEALAYAPESDLLYVPTMVLPVSYRANGEHNWYYGDLPDAEVKPRGEVVAIDLSTGAVKWRTKTSRLPVNGGLLHTAGGLVFQGLADGRLVAFDDQSGEIVWEQQTGGAIRAAPSTVLLNGEQYLVVPTGNGASSSSASLLYRYSSTPESRTPARLLAFKLGGEAPYPALANPEPVPKPAVPRQDSGLAHVGESLFDAYSCVYCHGTDGGASVGGNVVNLNRRPPASLAFLKLVLQKGALKSRGMPAFEDLPDEHAEALFAHLVNSAWDAYERDSGSND